MVAIRISCGKRVRFALGGNGINLQLVCFYNVSISIAFLRWVLGWSFVVRGDEGWVSLDGGFGMCFRVVSIRVIVFVSKYARFSLVDFFFFFDQFWWLHWIAKIIIDLLFWFAMKILRIFSAHQSYLRHINK